ncbi:MAG TPA: amino acid ABC transporter permease [Candidatus Faecivivens stercorigallinarum]|nr:amino acid ABC transporter permease [Candidatus Faecivivens stercorigallinarum]
MNFTFIKEALPQVLTAIPVTLEMALLATLAGWILGILIAVARRNKIPVVSQICAVFVSFIRGVPMVILLYVAYYALPMMIYSATGVDTTSIPAIWYAIVALSLDQAAYSSEVFRAALDSVNRGQLEAAWSVGMTTCQAMRRIVFPQALAVALPNLSGLFVGIIKGTSLAYYVGVYEITATANLLANPGLNFIEAYVITTVIYELISFICNRLFHTAETRLNRFRPKTAA